MEPSPALGAAVDITRVLSYLCLLVAAVFLAIRLFRGFSWTWFIVFLVGFVVLKIISLVIKKSVIP
jgi:hypothetical protein